MSRVLITGVDGFTGRYLARALHRRGHEVHGIVREAVGDVEGVAALHVADLLDGPALADVAKRVEPQKLAHLAGVAFVAHGNADVIYQTNVLGTRNVLEALLGASSALDAVLLASSANVYGNTRSGILDESTPFAPVSDYAVSKVAMEYVANLYRTRLPIIIARPFNYTGRGQDEGFLVPKIVATVRARKSVIELGNLDVARDFSDVRTVVEYYRQLLECPDAVGKTFNVCSGVTHTLQDVLAMARELSGHSFDVKVNPAYVRANEVKSLCGDRRRLDAVVGDVPAIPLRDTIQWMLNADSLPGAGA